MIETIINSFEVWTNAQGIKSRTRVKSVENISLEGIIKLRELILQLAVSGKLVPQNPNDEPASEVIKKIVNRRKKLIKGGKNYSQKQISVISKEEEPFQLPNGWTWARLPEIAEYYTGRTPSTKNPEYWSDKENGIPWISISDMSDCGYINDSSKFVSSEASRKVFSENPVPAGTILMSFKLTIGKISILNIEAYHNEAIISINPFEEIDKKYLFKILPKRAREGNSKNALMGNTLNATSLALLLIPIPPLSEQKRIISKVDELMALCDKLEDEQFKNLKTHQVLVKTLLETLTQATDANELQEAWERMSAHFDTLFCTEDSIEQLKQTILRLAVMGKLVKQDPSNEPASKLLEKAATEKEKLLLEGKIKKQPFFQEIAKQEMLFDLPIGWAWARLQEITTLITDGKHGDCQNQQNSGYYFLSAKDIIEGKLNYEFAREINCEEFLETHRRTDLSPGDICMVNTGATVGKLAIASDNPKTQRTTFQKSVAVIKPLKGYLFNEYLKVFLISETKKMFIKSGGSAINNLLLGDLKKKAIPIPPLLEQQKIVKKVDELFILCDDLIEKIQKSQNIKVLLSKTIVEKAVS